MVQDDQELASRYGFHGDSRSRGTSDTIARGFHIENG